MPDAPIDFADPAVARFYDELPLWSAPFGQMILERVPLRPGLDIVDLGSGTGFLTVELAQRCGPTSAVTAVDPWHEAMDVLRGKCDYLGLTNVTLRETDAAVLDLADRSVDVIVSNLGVNNFDAPSSVLRHCRRVLRDGGTMVMTSNLVGHMGEFYAIYRETLEALDLPDRIAALDDQEAHRATVESTTALLEAAGFALTDVARQSFTMRFADGTALLQHYFIRLGFRPAWVEVAGTHADHVLLALEERLNAHAAAAGELSLTVPAACFTAVPR